VKSRRLRRHRNLQRQALGVVETYRNSYRGLMRVFNTILAAGDPSGGAAAARAAHHLAEVEAHLPKIREAIRSCRYPGAEHGDTHALLWGLWGQLSEAQLHFRGALESLQALGRLSRPAAAAVAPRRAPSKGKPAKPRTGKGAARTKPAKRAASRAAATGRSAKKSAPKPKGGRKSGPRSGR